MNQINLRDKILQRIDDIKKSCVGVGKNPYTVNVITYSGYGFNCNGDTIALIPEYQSKED